MKELSSHYYLQFSAQFVPNQDSSYLFFYDEMDFEGYRKVNNLIKLKTVQKIFSLADSLDIDRLRVKRCQESFEKYLAQYKSENYLRDPCDYFFGGYGFEDSIRFRVDYYSIIDSVSKGHLPAIGQNYEVNRKKLKNVYDDLLTQLEYYDGRNYDFMNKESIVEMQNTWSNYSDINSDFFAEVTSENKTFWLNYFIKIRIDHLLFLTGLL